MGLRFLLSLVVLSSPVISAQALMTVSGGNVRLLPSDASVLTGPESRKDIPCTIRQTAPKLGFDLGFHSGYELYVPLQELAGSGNRLTAIFSVTPENRPDDPVYFSQQWDVPALDDATSGRAALSGTFILGEGKYRINWLLRDRQERFCSARWQVSIVRSASDRQFQLRIPPGAALPAPTDPFVPEPPVKREVSNLHNALILVHVSPSSPRATALRTAELDALASILRSAAREPRIGTYSIVAFNLERNETIFRQRDVAAIGIPELGEAIGRLKLGVVEAKQLIERDTEAKYLGRLLAEETAAGQPGAVIFIGPGVAADSLTFEPSVKALGPLLCPVFYLAYGADAALQPGRDVIGSAVRSWKGSEFVITRPRDVPVAWANVMARLSDRAVAAGNSNRTGIVYGLVPKK